MLRLVRPVDRHSEVVRLLLRQLGQLDAEVIEVQPRILVVQGVQARTARSRYSSLVMTTLADDCAPMS
jgi:hypothetical protein